MDVVVVHCLYDSRCNLLVRVVQDGVSLRVQWSCVLGVDPSKDHVLHCLAKSLSEAVTSSALSFLLTPNPLRVSFSRVRRFELLI